MNRTAVAAAVILTGVVVVLALAPQAWLPVAIALALAVTMAVVAVRRRPRLSAASVTPLPAVVEDWPHHWGPACGAQGCAHLPAEIEQVRR